MELLYWLESIRNPVLDVLMLLFTEFGNENYEYIFPYLAMAVIYIIVILLVTLLFKLIEKWMHRSDRK